MRRDDHIPHEGAPRVHRTHGANSKQRRQVQVADVEYAAVSEGRIRIRIGAFIFLCMLAIVVIRLAELTMFSRTGAGGEFLDAPATIRADIIDRHGEVLATTVPTYALYAKTRYVWDVKESAESLASVFSDMDLGQITSRLTSGGDQVLVRRGLSPRERQSVHDLGLPGLMFEVEPQRVYPHGQLAPHFVGFTNVDLKGLAGAEKAFDDRMKTPNAPDVSLSVDLRVQNAVSDELGKSIERFHAKSGVSIVTNIKTGEILAMSSLPNYDPNNVSTTLPEFLYNHASMSTYELGSVFKPITMAMALDANMINLTETFPVQRPLRVRGRDITDDHASAVPMNAPTILAKSSNRGTALIALRAGGDIQQAFLKKLGLLDRVPIEFAESARPIVQSEWQDITTVTVSYGHGIAVTPLALAVATGALLNGGEYITPTILKRDSANPAVKRRVISPEVSQIMRDLMRYVVTDGTGRNARAEGYGVMGKTGTADKPSGDGYDEKRLVTTFISAFPYSDPTYVVLVTMDEPKAIEGTYGYATAGWNAAPTVGAIIERIAPILGVRRAGADVATSVGSGGAYASQGALQ